MHQKKADHEQFVEQLFNQVTINQPYIEIIKLIEHTFLIKNNWIWLINNLERGILTKDCFQKFLFFINQMSGICLPSMHHILDQAIFDLVNITRNFTNNYKKFSILTGPNLDYYIPDKTWKTYQLSQTEYQNYYSNFEKLQTNHDLLLIQLVNALNQVLMEYQQKIENQYLFLNIPLKINYPVDY